MHLLQPLRHTAFAGLWVSYTLYIAATTVLPTVLTLMILDWRGGIAALGIALSARTLGFLAGALVGGEIADRFARHKVICTASALCGFAALAIAFLLAQNLPAIAVCLFAAGAGEGAFRSAYQSIMVDVLAGDLLQRANALTTLSARIVQSAGPLAAVAFYSVAGAQVAMAIAGLCWLSAAAAVFLLRRHYLAAGTGLSPDKAVRPGVWASYREGLAEALRHRWFLAGLGVLLVWLGLGNSIQQLLLPVISRETLGGDSFIGIALGTYAVGALAGGLLLGSWKPRRPGVVAFVGLALYGFVPLAL